MNKKIEVQEIGGDLYGVVGSWEEEQEARKRGFKNILAIMPEKKLRRKKRRWLSGRPRWQRYDGIFQVK